MTDPKQPSYTFAQDASIIGLFFADWDQSPAQAVIRSCNTAARNLCGELRGTKLVDLLSEASPRRADIKFDGSRLLTELIDEKQLLIRARIRAVPVLLQANLMEDCIQGVLIDASEEEDHRDRSEKQGEALRYIAKIAGTVVHDLNAPQTVINVCTQMMELDQVHNFERYSRQFELLLKSVQRIQHLSQGIREAARGHHEDFQLISLQTLLREWHEDEAHRALDRGIALAIDKTDVSVTIQKEAVLHALSHLYDSALEALEGVKNGQIRIRVREENRQWIQISMEDNSEEVPELHRSSLFEYGNHHRSKDGITLFSVHQVVQNHEGRLQYIRREDFNCFCFTLPRMIRDRGGLHT